jgi:GcrA cell cycle regulator
VLRLLTQGAVSLAQVELAAAAISARTNGGTESELLVSLEESPAPLEEAPAPAQAVLARTEAATLADPSLTTAEKLCALVPRACRWPCGDPRDRNFHFCSASTTRPPYCERHRGAAYIAQPLRPGFWPSVALASALAPVGAHECPSRSSRVCRS